jgi:ApaG protein
MENSRQTIHSLTYTAITSEISITVCPEFVDHHDTQGTRADVVSVPGREERNDLLSDDSPKQSRIVNSTSESLGAESDEAFATNAESSAQDTISKPGEQADIREEKRITEEQKYELGALDDLASDADFALDRNKFEEVDLFDSEADEDLDLEEEELELTYSEVETDVFRDQRKEEFAFTYNVTIRNDSSETVQLLERHWVINSGGALFAEVEGPGVVGVQPVLAPGEEFEYTSWCLIADPVGSMSGGYTFVNEEGDEFLVRIPEFDLVCPRSLH